MPQMQQTIEVGDKIRLSMHGGRIVDAVVKAILDTTDGLKYQVDFGQDQMATGFERQIVKAQRSFIPRTGLESGGLIVARFWPSLPTL